MLLWEWLLWMECLEELYLDGEYQTYMILAGICGLLLLSAWVVFLVNVLMSIGLKGLLGIFKKSKLQTKDLIPEA